MEHNKRLQQEQSSQSSTGQKQYDIYTVDSYLNGISIDKHRISLQELRGSFPLTLSENHTVRAAGARYEFQRGEGDEGLHQLETELCRLSRAGILRETVFYFGVHADPFHPFDGKFDASMRMLDLLKRFQPGMVYVQTRSPLLVLALPQLQALGDSVAVTIPIETTSEAMVQRYTPGLPRAEERLKVARTLVNLGVEVTLQVGPLLPYGDWKKDAPEMAEKLLSVGAPIVLQAMSDGSERTERRLRGKAVVQKLACDRRFHWLRADATAPLQEALERVRPDCLTVPESPFPADAQLSIFAA